MEKKNVSKTIYKVLFRNKVNESFCVVMTHKITFVTKIISEYRFVKVESITYSVYE